MAYGEALKPLTIYELDKGFYTWLETATTSDSPCPEYWAPMGIDTLVAYPGNGSGATLTLQLLHLKGDVRLLADASYLDLGDEEINRIIDYAQWVLAFKEGIKEATDNVEPMKQLFLQAASSRASRLKKLALYRRYMGQERDEAAPARQVPPRPGVRG